MRSQQQFALLYFLGIQAGLNGVQAYNAAGSAIRMNGASVAVPGYESVPSDFLPFNYTGTQYDQIPFHTINPTNLPSNARISFNKYNDSGWKGAVSGHTPGTAAGAKYKNSDRRLPTNNSDGTYITYREFDVNNRLPNSPRDSERFVVGSDGSIYYTNDHYTTFVKIK